MTSRIYHPKHIDEAFALFEAAAVAGERCPMTYPYGPIPTAATDALIASGHIRSMVYGRNYRVVEILKGPHAGKSTAPEPNGRALYMVNGRHVDHRLTCWADKNPKRRVQREYA